MLPHNILGLAKGQGLNMDMGLQMRDKGMSSKDASKEETPHNLQRSWQRRCWEVINKTRKMFQAMAIVSQKMGNLSLEINQSLKTKLTTVEGEK